MIDPYQDEKEGACTSRLYTPLSETENAYDSPCRDGRSTNTASSSSDGAELSTLVNLSHSFCPFSSSRDSGIHASKYDGFMPSYKRIGQYELTETVQVLTLRTMETKPGTLSRA